MLNQAVQSSSEATTQRPTVWGLSPLQLHDRFWAARGVQVIRQGDQTEITRSAELFLLTDRQSLFIFRLGQIVDTLNWLQPKLLFARLRCTRDQGYRERILTDDDGRFQRFERVYGGTNGDVIRIALTPDRKLAQHWQQATGSPSAAWRTLRRSVRRDQRTTVSIEGSNYHHDRDDEVMHFIRELVQVWRRPDVTIHRAQPVTESVWGDRENLPQADARFIGPVWVGTGRQIDDAASVVGPAVLWDDPAARPLPDRVRWDWIAPASRVLDRPVKPRAMNRVQRGGKRAFDIMFASAALVATLPLYPLVMLAIWIEDGSPFFFAHRRETMGGREFPCIKFRTMRKDAEKIKQELIQKNQADGPQFFMEDDPRLTRVGKLIRKCNIDELPQFFNVLLGHMSVVGPRPSPHNENQYCPPWREARLSVRPGITGLWQVMRSRQEGLDFQEWIRYDIEYVENWSWRLDFWIILKSFSKLIGR